MSYRDKIEGNELDLSLNNLTEVPVKELAAATKATCLDLSCNRIETLPNDFATLTHLVKIDLSKNILTELPAKFGNLIHLQHLDLYENNIVSLPVSFCKLKNLRWLDLKNNPLEPKLKSVAGDCLDEKECQACAKKVVAYMQSIESEQEREKQKKLKVAREKEAIERAKMEKELEEQRRLKKIEKEKRKAESKAKREAQLQEKDLQNRKMDSKNEKDHIDGKQSKAFGAEGSSCVKVLFISIIATCFVIILGILFGIYTEIIPAHGFKFAAKNSFDRMRSILGEITKTAIHYIPKLRERFLKFVFHYMGVLTHFSANIEEVVSLYA